MELRWKRQAPISTVVIPVNQAILKHTSFKHEYLLNGTLILKTATKVQIRSEIKYYWEFWPVFTTPLG